MVKNEIIILLIILFLTNESHPSKQNRDNKMKADKPPYELYLIIDKQTIKAMITNISSASTLILHNIQHQHSILILKDSKGKTIEPVDIRSRSTPKAITKGITMIQN